jgi:hypothetical protein
MTKQQARRTLLTIVAVLACTEAARGLTPTQSVTPSPTPTVRECEFFPVPRSGPPGTRVTLAGSCMFIRYHRIVSIYFDRTRVTYFDGVGPQYSTEFIVPYRAAPGPHTLTMESIMIPFGTVTASFEVTGEPLPCFGDCNLDERVTVDELVTGVRITLGLRSPDSCPPFDVDRDEAVAVNELVLAVDAALRGCDPGCHDEGECEEGARCLAPGEFRGCGFCQPLESDCERDSDCEGGLICAPVKEEGCPCTEVKICQPGCDSDDDCAIGEQCDLAKRCGRQRCASEACPPFFLCRALPTFGYACIRQPCGQDGDCDGGACVNGACYETLGTCALPVP